VLDDLERVLREVIGMEIRLQNVPQFIATLSCLIGDTAITVPLFEGFMKRIMPELTMTDRN